MIEHAAVMAKGDVILPADLPIGQANDRDDDDDAPPGAVSVGGSELFEMPYAEAKDRAVEAFDAAYVDRLMKRGGGNLSESARLAGMDRSNFRRLVKRAKEGK